MIKLRELIDEKKCGIGQNPEDTGCEPASGGKGKKKDKKSKKDEPKTPGLGGGWDAHDGPESAEDAVGDPGDPKKESAIVQGIRAMADKNRERDFGDQEKSVDIDGEETTNLCDVEVPGTNMFCGDPLETDEHPNGIPRAEMPQLKSKPWAKGEGPDPNNPDAPEWVWNEKEGKWEPNKFEESDEEYAERVPAAAVLQKQNEEKKKKWLEDNPDKTEKDFEKDPGPDEEANTENLFQANLERLDPPIKTSEPKPRNVSDLKATQNELKPANVAFMVDVLMRAKPPPHKDKQAADDWALSEKLREPIIVSKDGYILDGHHRWAALVALDIANGGSGDIEMMVKEVDAGAEELVEKTNEFTRDQGLQTKPADLLKEETVQPFAELYYRMKNR
jgi:hypothetical protein